MPVSNPSRLRNVLLSRLSEADFGLLGPHLDPVDLPKGFVIVEPGQAPAHVYFRENGIGSVVAVSPDGQQAEAGLYGREGMSTLGAVLAADRSSHLHIVQVAGWGHRIDAVRLAEASEKSPTMRRLFLRFVHVFMTQTSYTSLSNAVHSVDERLARWILMCHDRIDGDELELTHEFLAVMLAVRRPSVTMSLHVLEGNGFIRADRGQITVRDRKAFERFAGDAYGTPEAEFRRLIG